MAARISYYSTNRNFSNFSDEISFPQALLMGQAPDGGLFMPNHIPQISQDEIARLRHLPFDEIASFVLGKFLDSEIPQSQLKKLAREAYTFEVPLERVDAQRVILRLDQGPTASFKDFAAQMLARLTGYFKGEIKNLSLLVATSGDTGSAIGHAFHGISGIDVYILYPRQEVSPAQEVQLTSINENVHAVAIDGKFDDCQNMVKSAFADPELSRFQLISGNSINIGRLLPQMIYYFYAYSRVAEPGQKVVFSIPSGNFGNALGCELARRMGLPVEKIIIATNANDEFPRFLQNGEYRPITPSRKCLSNSMNVGHPSNLARLFDLYGGNVDKSGVLHKKPNLEEMRRRIFGVSISDEETVETMKRFWQEKRVLLEPHGAVAAAGLEEFLRAEGNPEVPLIFLETAHPGKFSEILQEQLGITPELPSPLKQEKRKNRYAVLPDDYTIFREYLFEHLKK